MILDASSAHSFVGVMDFSGTVLHNDRFLQDLLKMGDALFVQFFCSMNDFSYMVLIAYQFIVQKFKMLEDVFFSYK